MLSDGSAKGAEGEHRTQVRAGPCNYGLALARTPERRPDIPGVRDNGTPR